MKKTTILETQDGMRLDAFLVEDNEDLSRSQAQKMIKDGCARINTFIIKKPALKLRNGDQVIFSMPIKESALRPIDLKLEILFEDEDILAVNKPFGLVVHPTPYNLGQEDTLANGLLSYVSESILQVGSPLRPGIVHRLDKDTSGVILVAKTVRAYLKLVEMFSTRKIDKTYLTLVYGAPEHDKATIDAPLDKFFAGKKMVLSQFASGKKAITHYKVKQTFDLENDVKTSFVEVDLETGRTHQIRVHFASIGHPVLGDATYGFKKANLFFEKNYGLNRQFLHAFKIKFMHPFTKKELVIQAPLYSDLQTVLDKLISEQS